MCCLVGSLLLENSTLYSRTSMAQTPLELYKYVLDKGSLS